MTELKLEPLIEEETSRKNSVMEHGSNRSGFRADIEGLRGIAVLIVVAFHCGVPGFTGGFTGVDVFFVLSGYLITGLLVSEIENSSRLSLLQFYTRRMRRLLPACALTLFVSMLIGMVILSPNELTFAGRAARATALYLSNVFFGINAADYFGTDVEINPMLHTWSLAVEEQFYICWPLLIMLGLRNLRSRKVLVVLLSGLTTVSLFVSIWMTARGGTFAFYQLPSRAWEFGIGGLAVLSVNWKYKIKASDLFWGIAGWAGVAAIMAGSYWIPNGANFPGFMALIPVLGTALALFAGAELPGRYVGKLLGSVPLQFLGKTSYSWYLWHWPFLVLATALIPGISVSIKVIISGLSLILAAATHYFIENPIRFHPYLIRRPWATVSMTAVIAAISLGTALASINLGNRIASRPEMKRISNAVGDIARMPRKKCVTLQESPEVKKCFFGDTNSGKTIILFGDSHAIQWFNPIETIAKKHGWKLITLVKSGCPAADVSFPSQNQAYQRSCTAWRKEVFREIDEIHPSLVIIGSATLRVGNDEPNSMSITDWRLGTKRTLRRVATSSEQVVLMRDTPFPRMDIPNCLSRSARHSWFPGTSCEMDRARVVNAAIFEAEKAAIADLRNVHIVDMTDQFCNDSVCLATRNNEIIYRDDNHLTGTFAETLWQILDLRLASVLDYKNTDEKLVSNYLN